MRTNLIWILPALALAIPAQCAERIIKFSEFPVNQTPTGFRGALAGQGSPGDWKILLDEVPPVMPTLTPEAPKVTRRAVLAQLSQERTDERFPMFIFDGDSYGDFTLTTSFKLVEGVTEQMAGIAFRIQDEKNFYVIRASGLGNNLRFYKVVQGQRGNLIGPDMPISKGAWYNLKIECKGNNIQCWLDGKEAMPTLTDSTFSSGKIGFWTKSDAVSYFGDTTITYQPREVPAQAMIRDIITRYPRILGLQTYTLNGKGEPRVLASKDLKDVGAAGDKTEADVIAKGAVFYAKGRSYVSVVMPLRDRNGNSIAAVTVKLSSFPGETEQSALVRAQPIVNLIQDQVQSLQDLQ